MSRALVCDGPDCSALLYVNSRGDDADGESEAWIMVETAGSSFNLCTRACAHALLDDEGFVAAVTAQQEAVAEVARLIREGREADDDGDRS